MKTIYRFIALALAGCLMLAACEKEETNNNNDIPAPARVEWAGAVHDVAAGHHVFPAR